MNRDDFAATIKQKLPQYKDIPNNDLVNTYLSKYPQYRSVLDPETGLFGQKVTQNTDTTPPAQTEAFERSSEYPPTGITELGPSIVAAQTPFLAKDIAQLGIGAAKSISPSAIAGKIGSTVEDLKNLIKAPPEEGTLQALTSKLSDTLINARKAIGEKLGEMRGTSQSALDRLSDIAEKGTAPSYTPQETAAKFKDYFSKIPQTAPKMEEDIAGATTKDVTAQAPELGEKQVPVHPDFASKPLQKGDIVTLKSTNPDLPDVQAMHNGPHTVPGNVSWQLKQPIPETDPTKIASWQEAAKKYPSMGDTPLKHGINSDVSSGSLEEYGYRIPQSKPADPSEELNHLLKLRSEMRDQISKKTMDQSGNIVKAVSSDDERAFTEGINQINNRISQLPGGQAIRAQEQKFSDVASVYDDLQSKMKEPNQAQAFLQKLFTNPTGRNKDYLLKIQKLDQLAGTNVYGELKNTFDATKGLTYEQLKHPVASTLRAAIPEVGSATRAVSKAIASVPPRLPIGTAFSLGQTNPEAYSTLQSIRDKMGNK